MRILACVAVAVLMAACSARDGGWRSLTTDETAALDRQSLAQNPWLKSPPRREAVADFDGDGRRDRAVFRVNGESYAVLVLGGDGQVRRLGEARPRVELANMELGVLAPGIHRTFCSRRESDEAGCRPTVTLKAPGVVVTTFEAAQIVYFWNGTAFDVAALSD